MREAEAYWVWGIEARDRSGNLDRVGQEGPCHRLGIIGGGAEGRVSILALLRGRERPQVQKKDENINRSSEWWDLDYFILFSSCSLYTLIFCMILSSQMFKHKLFLLCKQNKFCALIATPQGKLKQAVNWASLHLMPPQHLRLRHN